MVRLFAAFPIVAGTVPAAIAQERLPPGATSCSGCHAPAPMAGNENSPKSLATLSSNAIEEALAAYRSGARRGTIMPRIAKGFSEAESEAIATALGRPESGVK